MSPTAARLAGPAGGGGSGLSLVEAFMSRHTWTAPKAPLCRQRRVCLCSEEEVKLRVLEVQPPPGAQFWVKVQGLNYVSNP